MHKQKGFSLIELLIVVAIILIIAAIAIPNLLRARISANESSAAASIRSMNTAEISYQTAYQVFAPNLQSLGPGAATGCPSSGPTSSSACVLDFTLANASAVTNAKSGYYFSVSTPSALQYFVSGMPASSGTSGVKGFCSVEDSVVRFQNPYSGIADHTACLGLASIGN